METMLKASGIHESLGEGLISQLGPGEIFQTQWEPVGFSLE